MASLVLETRLHDHYVVTIHQVDQAVFFGDAAGPGASEQVLEGFRHSDALGRIPQRIVDVLERLTGPGSETARATRQLSGVPDPDALESVEIPHQNLGKRQRIS